MSDNAEKSSIEGEVNLYSGDSKATLPLLSKDILTALHNHIHPSLDKLNLYKHEYRRVDIDDIRQICLRLKQWTQQYEVVSTKFRFLVEHGDMEIGSKTYVNTYESLDKFFRYDLGVKDPIKSIKVNFSCIYVNNEYGSSEKVDVVLDLTGHYRHPEYYLSNKKIQNFFHIDRMDSDEVSAKFIVEYYSYLVGQGVMNVVEQWYASLNEVRYFRENWITRTLFDGGPVSPRSIATFIVVALPALLGCLFAFSFQSLNDESFWYHPNYFIALSVVLYVLFRLLFSFLIGKLDFYRREINKIPLIVINSGDREAYEKYLEENKNLKNKRDFWMNSVVIAMVVSVAASVLVGILNMS